MITSGATLDQIEAIRKPATVEKANSIGNTANISSTNGNYTKAQILGLVEKISNKYGVDEKLVQAVIKQESGYNPKAKSHAGALGLMQLMPATAKSLGVKDPMNPAQNIEGGVKYLKNMLEEFNGNTILALAAYNAGPNAVKKYGTVPPYKETQNYVKSILKNYL
ncbi:lytic transglycosylase domain-containing protein [bacterium]|nr:lytic transglycosylase domain-containing protein [bacterium]